ncbi:MAG: AI-2E family transporter [Bdellovibrio sp.]
MNFWDQCTSKGFLMRWLLLFCFLAAFIYINWPFIIPMAIAGIFALGLHDFINSLSRKLHVRRRYSIWITLLAGMTILWVPLSLAIYRVVAYVSQPQIFERGRILSQVHSLKNFILDILRRISSWTGVDVATPAREVFDTLLRKTGELLLNYSSEFFTQLPAILLASFVFLLFLLMLLAKAEEIKSFIHKSSPFNSGMTNALIAVFKKSCSITLFSTFVIGLIQAAVVGLGSLIFNEGDFWLVLTITFFVSFIPVIGAAPVGYLLALLAFLGDRTGSAIGLTVVATIAGSIDNVLKPFLVSGENEISPILGFTSVVGAIIMFGLPGLLLGPVIMNLFVGIAKTLKASESLT